MMRDVLSEERIVLLGQGLQAHVKHEGVFVHLNEESRGYDSDASLLFPRLFESVDKQNVTAYLKLVYERVLTTLTNKTYANLCDKAPSSQYIETIIGSILYPFICIVYAKYCYGKQLQLSGETNLIGAKPQEGGATCISGGSLVYSLHRNSNLSTIIYTKIVEFLGLSITQYIPLTCHIENKISPNLLNFRQCERNVRDSICLFLIPTGRTGYRILNKSKKYHVVNFNSLLSDAINTDDAIPLMKQDYRVRAKIKEIKGIDEFETLIYTLLADFMPYQCLENFIFNHQMINEYIALNGYPKAIVTGQGLLFNYLFSFWVAQCRLKKIPFYISQHGGVYGECEQTATEYIERKLSDNFLSWGWHDERVIPLDPTKRLSISSRLTSRIPIKKYDVLIVGTFEPLVIADYVGMYGYKLFDYYLHQERVIKIILQSDFKNIYLRAYPGKEASAIKLMKLSDQIKLADTNENILLQMSRSKLVMFDYLGASSFIDSLRLNIPSLVVYDNKITQIRKSARENYALAEKAKIVMNIDHFKQNIFDIKRQGISAWWHSDVCSMLKTTFMKRQYGIGRKYMRVWKDFFETI